MYVPLRKKDCIIASHLNKYSFSPSPVGSLLNTRILLFTQMFLLIPEWNDKNTHTYVNSR